MTTHVVYRLVGYDKRTETLAVAFDVPRSDVAQAKAIVGLNSDHDAQLGDLELPTAQSHEIARLIRAPLDTERHDYFLEPYVLQDEAAQN